MKEYVKNNNALTALIPFLNIQNSLPADGTDDELIFIPTAGVYMWRNNQWERVIQAPSGSSTDAFVGEIIPYYGNTAADKSSNGWLLCDGSTYNYNDYPELALLIDDTLTPGSTFQVPDLREKYPTTIGTNSDNTFNSDVYTLGQTKQPSIEETTNTTPLNTDTHTHTIDAIKHTHTFKYTSAVSSTNVE